MKSVITVMLGLSVSILCAPCNAGETFSQTFYTGEDSAVEQARTQSIHYDNYAEIARNTAITTASSPLQSILHKAASTSQLERPVYRSGFNVQTVSTQSGLEFSAAYRF